MDFLHYFCQGLTHGIPTCVVEQTGNSIIPWSSLKVGVLQSFLDIIPGRRSQEECIISFCETRCYFLKELGLSCTLQTSINKEQIIDFLFQKFSTLLSSHLVSPVLESRISLSASSEFCGGKLYLSHLIEIH